MMKNSIKPIAIHLPQFHPVPENDAWWGKGFTEWTNVVKGVPRFEGHYQPHLPADLGFYDLRLAEARLAQEALAKEYGVYGFCYYHYWFNGHRLLHEPLDRKLMNPKEDLPFMMCWANENWTRAWDGGDKQILLKQNYSEEDDRNHIRHLIPYFKDARYIRVNDKPIFAFYKPDLFPNMQRTLEIFREEARHEGIELHLIWFERWIGWHGEDVNQMGFDAAIEFQPLSKSMKEFLEHRGTQQPVYRKLVKKLNSYKRRVYKKLNLRVSPVKPKDQVISYPDFVDFDLQRKNPLQKCYPGVSPMWDNSSRRVHLNATILDGSTPEHFRRWYHGKADRFEGIAGDDRFIFINAWNEWAEGNHLEPCQRWGKAYLEALLP
ncbi:MAG: glycoside hydrolase family 99-like domain-containing protein [Chitinophagaceae bacterium]|nr:glycoside hydrolase family 99-like domain-containing protein [Chitinophagaceae bacterium]